MWIQKIHPSKTQKSCNDFLMTRWSFLNSERQPVPGVRESVGEFEITIKKYYFSITIITYIMLKCFEIAIKRTYLLVSQSPLLLC